MARGGTGPVTCVPVDVSIVGSQPMNFPTTQKAKGICIVSNYNDWYMATNGMANPYHGSSIDTAYTMTFSDNSVSFGRAYGSVTATFKGYYWY